MNTRFPFGTHPLVIATSLSLCLAGLSAFGADATNENTKWLAGEMESAHSIKPGMTLEQILGLFVREPGFVNVVTEEDWGALVSSGYSRAAISKIERHALTYRMRSCSLIKIDIQFVSDSFNPKPGTRIKWISKPYLEQAIRE